ncbi:hypothetical protein [Streptomyces sp. Root369]|uniref:hypothetical protein n=1 Tax=Streptomyces sp. Root369 TaxID=1736523 RepID=UPI00070B47B6|nr:hypothetical protein [Streptomyces sp. Root369]KQW16497.1 hypothetical protein ASD08_26200 [Streptomyces sp. Root369]
MTGIGVEVAAQAARSRALAVLRIRSRALAVALLPAAVAVVLLAGGSTSHLVGGFWDSARLAMTVLGAVVLLAAGAVALVVARARPAVSPTVAIAEESAPDLYRMVRDLADRLDVPAPSAIALTPDCDSWLEDRTHPAHGPPPQKGRDDEIAGVRSSHRRVPAAPVLVIGSPFLWWMRVGELRAVLAPVVAGTGPSAHPDIAAARRFVRGLDAAVAVGSVPGRCPLTRVMCAGVAWVARLLLRSCREHATQMERGVAAAAAERAQAVDYGLRIVAQEQVGLAYAGWDRLLTRVALPAWRMGRWPSRLDAGVVAALTELSRRDRLAEGFASRLGERPACDLLEEPGAVDEAASLLAARLFHGGPAETGQDWSPVDWQEYPEEVVDRKWRLDAARLHRVLDAQGVSRTPGAAAPESHGPTLSRVLAHLSAPGHTGPTPHPPAADRPTTSTPTYSPAPTTAVGGGLTSADDTDTVEHGREQGPTRTAADGLAPAGTAAPLRDPASTDHAPMPGGLTSADEAGAVEHRREQGPTRAAADGLAPAKPATPPQDPASTGHAPVPPTDGVATTGGPASPDDAGAVQHESAAQEEGLAATAPVPPPPDAAMAADLHREPASADAQAAAPPAPSPVDVPAAEQHAPASADAPVAEQHAASPVDVPAAEQHAPASADAPPTAPHPPSSADALAAGPHHPVPPDDPAAAERETAAAPHGTPAADDEGDAGGADAIGGSADGEAETLAAALTAELAREEAAAPQSRSTPDATPWDDTALPLFPLQPPRSARELLTDHVTAMVCCAAIDTAGAVPGLDWLDGPSLLINGERAADLTPRVLSLVEDGDPAPLRAWLVKSGIRPEKPVRLV